jgi:hypothetical protein
MGGKFCLPDFINGSKEEKPLVDKAVDFIKTMGAARIAAMGAVGLALVGFFCIHNATDVPAPDGGNVHGS